ncbi:hypothetical protein [Solicola sp. PLA-1-18]|uniref:hypothetical protein n=1 Tax=Solicola sp. PLA-1-18 TaxID=3380532 RepID=UPI003B7C8657
MSVNVHMGRLCDQLVRRTFEGTRRGPATDVVQAGWDQQLIGEDGDDEWVYVVMGRLLWSPRTRSPHLPESSLVYFRCLLAICLSELDRAADADTLLDAWADGRPVGRHGTSPQFEPPPSPTPRRSERREVGDNLVHMLRQHTDHGACQEMVDWSHRIDAVGQVSYYSGDEAGSWIVPELIDLVRYLVQQQPGLRRERDLTLAHRSAPGLSTVSESAWLDVQRLIAEALWNDEPASDIFDTGDNGQQTALAAVQAAVLSLASFDEPANVVTRWRRVRDASG